MLHVILIYRLVAFALAAAPLVIAVATKADLPAADVPGTVASLAELVGVPLGVLPDAAYRTATVDFAIGDTLVVYSDGVTEARNAAGVQFGDQRLAQFVAEHAQDNPRDLVERVRKASPTADIRVED